MIDSASLADRIGKVFEPTQRGIVGLVDGLLGLCRDQPLRFDYEDGHCRIRPLGPVAEGPVDLPLPRSAFRAVLARIASLCNEQSPDSVTPYSGEGELSIGIDPPSTLRVAFTNLPSEQHLEVGPLDGSTDEPDPPGSRG